jgi:hypothetical protein
MLSIILTMLQSTTEIIEIEKRQLELLQETRPDPISLYPY